MTTTTKEWLVILLYFLLLTGCGIGEAVWLYRRQWAGLGKALLFALVTNVVGYGIGFSALFITVGVSLALAWDGTIEKLPFKGGEAVAFIVLALLLFPALLTLLKRGGLALLKMAHGGAAWRFAVAASLLFLLLPLGLAILLTKIFWRFL